MKVGSPMMKNISIVYSSPEPASVVPAAAKSTLKQMLGMGIIIGLMAQPAIKLDQEVLNFTPRCDLDGNKITPARTKKTTYKISGSNNQAHLPLFWGLVIALSHGITNAASSGLQCQADIRRLSHMKWT